MVLKGGDTSALRAYNERLILNAIRTRGPLSKAEIGRATGLSAQAAAVIVKGLLADGMLLEHAKVRGGLGQPKTPLALNPRGAFSIGVKIGRRSVEAVLVDFQCSRLRQWRSSYAAPIKLEAMALARDGVRSVMRGLPKPEHLRIVGLGIAMPSQIYLWAAELGLEPDALADWAEEEPATGLAVHTGFLANLYNDANAACAAELELGSGALTANSLYLYVGAFIGGSVVMNGQLQHGARGNAGAVASMPMPDVSGTASSQLLHTASLVVLEDRLRAAGQDAGAAIDGHVISDTAERVFDDWCDLAGAAIAKCIACAASVIDFETFMLDGAMNKRWLAKLMASTDRALPRLNMTGLSSFELTAGSLGADARVMGAAILPLRARFSPQPESLVQNAQGPHERIALSGD